MKYLTSIIISLLLFSCESDSLPAPEPIDPDDLSNATVWRGETKTFTKVDNSDPNSEENQDQHHGERACLQLNTIHCKK